MDLQGAGALALVPPAAAKRLRTERGSIAVWQLRPNVYASEVSGYMSAEMARLIIELADPLYGKGTLHGFHNWLAMSNYDSSCRVELTAWVLKHRRESALHIGLVSRMVAMGVAVANLALGNLIHVYDDETALENALQATLQKL